MVGAFFSSTLFHLFHDLKDVQMSNGKPLSNGDRFPEFNHKEKEAAILNELDAPESSPMPTPLPPDAETAARSGNSDRKQPDSEQASDGLKRPSRKVRIKLKAVSNPVPGAEEKAIAKIRAKTKGKREYLLTKKETASQNSKRLRKNRRQSQSVKFWTDPFVIDPSRRKTMQKWAVWAYWVMIILVCMLMAFENHASASLLTRNAALGFTIEWNAKIFLATVALGGVILGFALKLLPQSLRGPAELFLTVVFAVSLCAFALSTGLATGDAIGGDVQFTDQTDQVQTEQPKPLHMEWIVFTSILFLNVTSGAIAKLALGSFWSRWDCCDTNPRYQRAVAELEDFERQYQDVQDIIANIVRRLAYIDQLEQEAIAVVRSELQRKNK